MTKIIRVALRDGQWKIDWSAVTSIVETYYRCVWRNELKRKEDIDKYVVQQSPESFLEKAFRSTVTVFSKDRLTYIVVVDYELTNKKAKVCSDSYVRQLRDYVSSGNATGDALAKRLADISNAAAAEATKFAAFCAQVSRENQAGRAADVAKYGVAATIATGVKDFVIALDGVLLAAYLVPAGSLAMGGLTTTTLARGCIKGAFTLLVDAVSGEYVSTAKNDAKVIKVTGTILLDFVKAAATGAGGKVNVVVKISDQVAKAALDGTCAYIEGKTAHEAVKIALVNAGLGVLADSLLKSEIVKRQISRLQVQIAGDVILNQDWRRDAGAAKGGAEHILKSTVGGLKKVVLPAPDISNGGASLEIHAPALRMARVSAAIARA